MRNFFNTCVVASLIIFTGCITTAEERRQEVYNKKKQTLKQEIEMLRLERRKLILQQSIDQLDEQDIKDLAKE